MGQKLDAMMNHKQFLHEMVQAGNIEAIRTLHRKGANLEWTDEEGKTPLILACMDPALVHVAKSLIELGANVNAYGPGPHGGTPLHHAAKIGSQQTIELLLSHKANALVRNDNHQTPLDVARSKRHTNVVRAIENHICYFSGWMRVFSGPWFLEAVTPQLVSRNVWVVVVPYSEEPLKLEIMIYPTQQDFQPRTVINLWKSKIEEPTFEQCDPKLTIFSNFPRARYRLASAKENDKQQLQCFYSACRGIPQVKPPAVLSDTHISSHDASQPTANLTTSRGASVQPEEINTNGWGSSGDRSSYNGWGSSLGTRHSSEVNTNGWMDKPTKDDYNGWGLLDSKPVDQTTKNDCGSSDDSSSYNGWGVSPGTRYSSKLHTNGWLDKPAIDIWGLLDSRPDEQLTDNVQSHNNNSASTLPVPSAPPIPDEVLSEGSIHYPSLNSNALDMPVVSSMVGASMTNCMNNYARDSSCAVCWDAPIEGACIPCGHMAGCIPCLNQIKVNKGICPICLAKIDQVVRLYAV